MAGKPTPLGPPVLLKVMDRSKEPLPPIGSSQASPERTPSSAAASPENSTSDTSPLSGSLAVARRRNRNTPARLTDGDEARGPPTALMDILDPDVDGSPTHSMVVASPPKERSPHKHLAPLASGATTDDQHCSK